MNENKIEKNDGMEIDLQRLVGAVWSKLWVIIIVSILSAVIALGVTMFFITPQYQSSAMFYVNNNSFSVSDAAFSITSGDISVAKDLVDSYIVILQTRTSLNDVIDYAGVDRTYTELKRMISAASVNSTEIFEVVVTSPDPEEAEKIANAIAYILPKRISSIIEGTSAEIVDAAVVASKPSSPSYATNTLIGLVIGFILVTAAVVLNEVFDITIRGEEDVTQSCKHPILALVPDMAAPSKGGYYYRDDKKKEASRSSSVANKQPALIGKDISFAASEAYKLLRTKLQFSFADDNDCHVIGLSSALSGEGKSLSAVNLAYTLSQLGKKVVLIDCDMRRPTLAEKLGIQKAPGLSNYLSGQSKGELVCQKCGIKGDEDAFDVIAAGHNPPNPIELLSSARMTKVLSRLRDIYDYVILDLPPVGEVSDAMAVAKETDGILLVVRQNYCNRPALSDAARQFEFINARILGIVYNCTSESSGKYGKKYYKKYYNKYDRSYAYAASAKRAQERSKADAKKSADSK
ncbi:MAG: polysaccharide biosynthesis tyrosine autokinase [Oscillospiraceae bacterium]|nr:polysaccharide biosynthesis tyrosine autokinase [Oscillospiraceae bacterium]